MINARNVHQALPEACYQLDTYGIDRDSRNGRVRMFSEPFTTEYSDPRERVIFWPERDANPFFHLFESLWMLAGRRDVAYVAQFNKGMVQYSDDMAVFNAAYGFRWRTHFGYDQLNLIANALRLNPDCRRQVLTIWDGHSDLGQTTKDMPCNTQVFFQRDRDGRLDMMVTNRSNDLIWGAYGANAVHFSFLQEFMAGLIGCEVGRYWQTSMNTHVYVEQHGDLLKTMANKSAMPPGHPTTCPYEAEGLQPFPLMSVQSGRWQRELKEFLDNPFLGRFDDPFFGGVAVPMLEAWMHFKAPDPDRFRSAKGALSKCVAADWKLAAWEWLQRRERNDIAKRGAA